MLPASKLNPFLGCLNLFIEAQVYRHSYTIVHWKAFNINGLIPLSAVRMPVSMLNFVVGYPNGTRHLKA